MDGTSPVPAEPSADRSGSRVPPLTCKIILKKNLKKKLSAGSRSGLAVGDSGLNCSPKLAAYIPVPSRGSSIPCAYLFFPAASGLDAFSPYPLRRGCPAMPLRTTGRPEAADGCSFRTYPSFGSGRVSAAEATGSVPHPQKIKTDLSLPSGGKKNEWFNSYSRSSNGTVLSSPVSARGDPDFTEGSDPLVRPLRAVPPDHDDLNSANVPL